MPQLNADTADLTWRWFAVFVKARSEMSVATALGTKGFEQFVPTHRESHQWSDRLKHVEIPLFTRYVFCRFDGRFRLPVLTTPGVISIVGTPAGPAVIEQQEIDALKQVQSSGATCHPWPFLQSGTRVRVRRGALSGVEGLFVRSRKGDRLVLSVMVLERSVAVEVDATSIECVPERPQLTSFAAWASAEA